MKFLDSNGLTRLWTNIRNYMKASNVSQSAVSGVTSVESALSSIKSSLDNVIDDEYSQKNTYANTKIENTTAAYHKRFRGKYLGTSLTAAQSNAIKARTFDDLFVGDYWTINGVNYRIADIDYFYNKGNTALTTGHLVIVPDSNLGSAVMNDTDTTTGGYKGCKMRESGGGLASATSTIVSAFGDSHVLTYRDLITISTDSWAWENTRVELMNEVAVFGTNVFAMNGFSIGCLNTQFELFRQAAHFINPKRANWWLRSIDSATLFSLVDGNGYASCNGASRSAGVRPFFLLS